MYNLLRIRTSILFVDLYTGCNELDNTREYFHALTYLSWLERQPPGLWWQTSFQTLNSTLACQDSDNINQGIAYAPEMVTSPSTSRARGSVRALTASDAARIAKKSVQVDVKRIVQVGLSRCRWSVPAPHNI